MEIANIKIERRRRWDRPFAESWDEEQLERMLAMPFFSQLDSTKFPAHLPLAGIVKNDTRLLRYEPGEIVAREDDYGSSAFVVVSGEVSVIHPPGLPAGLLGRAVAAAPEGWWGALKRIFSRSKYQEVRSYAREDSGSDNKLRYEHSDGIARVRLKKFETVLADYKTTPIGQGELLGEVAALTRSPRTATLVVTKPTELLEIRWQGFRELRKYDKGFRQRVDGIYRDRNRVSYLKALPYFSGLSEDAIDRIAEHTLLESYGDWDWKANRQRGANSVPEEPVIVEQGDYIDGLLIVLNGSARIVGKRHSGKQTIGFLRSGDSFGLHEIANQFHASGEDHLPIHEYSLTAIGHADVLRIPTNLIEKELLQSLGLNDFVKLINDCEYPTAQYGSNFPEFIGEHHFANGRSTMVIDTNRCVRCDDCVTACARNHDNNPRFVRHGKQFANLMITNACMHCVDPVCMVGCPTGAISRNIDGDVVINDETCIGCSTCANSCPYDNIRMVEISDSQGNPVVDTQTHKPIVKATKCDLCVDNLGGPACERACPHDALMRVDLTDGQSLNKLLERAIQFEQS